MKNVLLLGATGTTGSALAQKLLSDTEYHVTLFSRHAGDVYSDSSRTKAISGDALNIAELKAALDGIDVVYCAIAGEKLPEAAVNIVSAMTEKGVERLIFMGAVGIYNEIPDDIDGEDNLDNEPEQIPNRKAVDIVEASGLNYTILRPGYLGEGDEDDFVLTFKDEPAKGYTTTIPSLVKLAAKLISDDELFSRENVSITHDFNKH